MIMKNKLTFLHSSQKVIGIEVKGSGTRYKLISVFAKSFHAVFSIAR